MNKIKSYTSIWNVEKVIYSINDFQLPFPVTFGQITWFTVSLLAVIIFGDLPPLSMIQGAFLKYLGLPVGITWFMSQKTFDGKKPFKFCISAVKFACRSKLTYMRKPVKLRTRLRCQQAYTYVKGEILHAISH